MAAAPAATVVISQPSFTSLSDLPNTGFGQSFTPGENLTITAINLYVSASAGGSDFTLRLYDFDAAGPALGTKILGSSTFLETNLSAAADWKSVVFASPVKVTGGKTYAFTIIAKDPGGSSTGWNNYGRSAVDAYPAGNLLGLGATGVPNPVTADLAFQVVAIPEPGVSLLLSFAMAAAATRRARPR
jgi:hypothetical protein